MSATIALDGTPLTSDALTRRTDLLVLRHLKFLLEELEEHQQGLVFEHIEKFITQYRESHGLPPPNPSCSPISTTTPLIPCTNDPPLCLPRSTEFTGNKNQELPGDHFEELEPPLIGGSVEGNDQTLDDVIVSRKRKWNEPQTDLSTEQNGSESMKDKLRNRDYLRTVFPPISMSLSTNVRRNEVGDRRYRFIEILSTLKVHITNRKGEKEEIGFTLKEVKAITNFFFFLVLGPSFGKRLVDIVVHYAEKAKDDLAEPNPAEIIDILTEGEKIPDAVKELLTILSNWRTNTAKPSKGWESLEQMQTGLDLYQKWAILSNQVEQRNPALLKFFARHNPHHRSNRLGHWKSTVKNYLISVLGLSSAHAVDSKYYHALIASNLVEKFGVGILLLLPPVCNYRLKAWGIQRMSAVYDSLATILPELKTICRLAETSVYRHIRSENSIPLEVAAFARQMSHSSLEQTLTDLGTVIEGAYAKESA